jgi:hypothetical protein
MPWHPPQRDFFHANPVDVPTVAKRALRSATKQVLEQPAAVAPPTPKTPAVKKGAAIQQPVSSAVPASAVKRPRATPASKLPLVVTEGSSLQTTPVPVDSGEAVTRHRVG